MNRFIARNMGGSGVFNGSDNYVDIGTLGNLGSNLNAGFSISFWVFSTSRVAGTILGTRVSSTNNYLLIKLNSQNGSNNAGFLQAQFSDTSTSHVVNGYGTIPFINNGQWHHIVATITPSSNTITIYVDNVSASITYTTQTTPASFANFTNDAFIGALNNNGTVASPFFTGSLADITIWNQVLSGSDVTNLYYIGATTTNPIAHYTFAEQSGSTTADITGNGNTGTWNGTLGSQWSITTPIKVRSNS